jgi:hypothetical protein
VVAYSEWQQSNVIDEAQRVGYQKACDATLQDMLDLEQVFVDQDVEFYTQKGVKRGVARRFVSDIPRWTELYRPVYEGGQC